MTSKLPLPVSTGDNFPVRIDQKRPDALGDKTLATVRKGYVLLDKSDRGPLDALEIYSVGIGRQNLNPNIDSGIFYAADRSTGLVTVANISDPKNPKPIEINPGQSRPDCHQQRVHDHRRWISRPDGGKSDLHEKFQQ